MGERVARRFMPNFKYYNGYFTSDAIKKRFDSEFEKLSFSINDYFTLLEKFYPDTSRNYLEMSDVLKDYNKILKHRLG